MIELKNIHGIVVNSMKYKETNLILKLYTRELGMVSLLVRNKKNFLPLSYEVFAESCFTLERGKNFYYCTDYELINSHYEIRHNIKVYSFINLFVNIIELSIMENMVDYKSYDLFIKTLDFIKISEDDFLNIVNGFLIKYISFQGFKPLLNLELLNSCSDFIFSLEEGIFIGVEDSKVKHNEIVFRKYELEYLYALLYNRLEILGKFDIDIYSKEKIFNSLIEYIKYIYDIPQLHSMNFIERMCLSEKWRKQHGK